jgi:hypothetical protein
MNRLQTQDGYFIHPDTYEPLSSIQVVITDSGTLSRSYYNAEGKINCWSFGCDFPDTKVPEATKQATRCLDCEQSIKRGNTNRGAPCKFFTKIKVAFPSKNFLYELRLGALSLFSKEDNRMNLYKYIKHLEHNRESIGSVLTEIYFVPHYNIYKTYFKPVRPLTEDELISVEQLSKVVTQEINPFENIREELFMANKTHIIRNVEARYPRIDKPYRFDTKAGKKGKSVPCDATEDGASYELDFILTKDQAKELYKIMQDAYKNAKNRDKSWSDKLDMPFKQQDDGTFIGKAKLKAAYDGTPTNVPDQFDAKNNRLEAGFMLTTGSTINVAVELIPYKIAATGTSGVSLRVRGVQVLKYLPYNPPSPFSKEEGFSADEKSDNPFVEQTSDDDDMFEAKETSSGADPFVDEIEEPVKRANKNEEATDEEENIEDIIASWGSDKS